MLDKPRNTWLIDIDGTLVIHNYYPFTDADIVIPSSLEFLKAIDPHDAIILTTARSYYETLPLIRTLSENGIIITDVLCDLPIGKRILINDRKNLQAKALAINVNRNEGICLKDLSSEITNELGSQAEQEVEKPH